MQACASSLATVFSIWWDREEVSIHTPRFGSRTTDSDFSDWTQLPRLTNERSPKRCSHIRKVVKIGSITLAVLAYTQAKVNASLPALIPFCCRDCNSPIPLLMCAPSSVHLLTQILKLKIGSPDLDWLPSGVGIEYWWHPIVRQPICTPAHVCSRFSGMLESDVFSDIVDWQPRLLTNSKNVHLKIIKLTKQRGKVTYFEETSSKTKLMFKKIKGRFLIIW